ncbi:MAG: helix-turn-helix domain-containing protein [Clostridia bacterium]|nr:helix-turn-helix domain-containing protein [Clostridia bacterium]
MFYSSELAFFRRVLANQHIDSYLISENSPLPDNIDKGLRNFFELNENYNKIFSEPWKRMKPNTVYRATDKFFCSYVSFLLPDALNTVLIAGPYTAFEITRTMILEAAEQNSFPAQTVSQITKYYGNIPVINDESHLYALLNSLAEVMWGSSTNYSVETITDQFDETFSADSLHAFKAKSDDALLSIQLLEERYDAERKMMQAVSQGKAHIVEQIFSHASMNSLEKRTDDPIRNLKNYLIISNTLLRKSAEMGSVHPFYIDSVSTEFAQRIETVRSQHDSIELIKEMVRKYCKLVKKHSSKDYSLLVQKVITIIDADLTADLSLKRFSSLLNVNASYLSSLFKKETGKNLTEYVAEKRIKNAAYLLTSTNLQIQTIAQHCGIYDVNYFAKTFKKITGKTPKEYRKAL